MSGEIRRRDRADVWKHKKQKLIRNAEEEVESKLGLDLFSEGEKRLGWLLTFASVSQLLLLLFFNLWNFILSHTMIFLKRSFIWGLLAEKMKEKETGVWVVGH